MTRALTHMKALGSIVLESNRRFLVITDGLTHGFHRLALLELSWRGHTRTRGDYAQVVYPDEKGWFLIADVFVGERRRGRGRGTLLVRACLELARRMDAEVVHGNLSANDDVGRLQAFYAGLGFAFEPLQAASGPMVGRVMLRLQGQPE
jgi:GNAT superfamily N-acetyltransferase